MGLGLDFFFFFLKSGSRSSKLDSIIIRLITKSKTCNVAALDCKIINFLPKLRRLA